MLRVRLGSAPDFDPSAVTMRYVVHPEDLESPLVHRLAYNGGVVAFKMGRRQGGPSRSGVR